MSEDTFLYSPEHAGHIDTLLEKGMEWIHISGCTAKNEIFTSNPNPNPVAHGLGILCSRVKILSFTPFFAIAVQCGISLDRLQWELVFFHYPCASSFFAA